MTNKTKMLSLLLAGTFLSSPAWGAQTVNSYDNLLQALETADADVVLDMNGGGIDLDGGAGLQVKDGQSVVFANIGTKGVSSWTGTSKNITNTGTIAIKNTIFDTNHTELASYAGGGVIFNQGGHITEISDSYFCNNTQNSVGTIWGGTVRNTNNGTIDLIKNVVFENNYAHAGNAAPHGGSILNGYSPTSTGYIKLIDGVKFINNSMTSDSDKTGGAHGVGIDNNEGGIIDKITNSQFINNKTYRTGEEIKSGNYHASAGALDNYNYIGEISNTLFKGNSAEVESASASAGSGAIMNIYAGGEEAGTAGRIDKIANVQFIENYTKSKNGSASGGAISNGSAASDGTGSIGTMENVLFSGNHVEGNSNDSGYVAACGGAIVNSGTIGSISGRFENNYVHNISGASAAWGGAINNHGADVSIGNINADFSGNYAKSDGGNVYGGAVLNYQSSIGLIKGDFTGNHAVSSANAAVGGAIYNNTGKITGLSGNFVNNYVESSRDNGGYIGAYGGAIFNYDGEIGSILKSSFVNNYAANKSGASSALGGAIYNRNTAASIAEIEADFSGNYTKSDGGNARGGAILNYTDAKIGKLHGSFIGNYVQSMQSTAGGGAIYNTGTIGDIINSDFIKNYASGTEARGGAIYSNKELNITADAGTSLFDGNYVEKSGVKASNAIYMAGAEDASVDMNLNAVNKGTITFNDGIDGVNYDVNVKGDGTGAVILNNVVDHVNTFNLSSGSVTHLGLNGVINTQNMTAETGSTPVGRQSTSASPIITVDVEVDKAANKVNSGAINVAEDVSGDYRVLVNALNPDILDNKDDAVVPFLFAPNDKEDTASSFSVARVIGSPYMWDGAVNAKGEEEGSTWYLNLTDILNPDYKDPAVTIAPEVVAGAGLHEAAIEQTRSVVRNVRTKSADNRLYCPGCGSMDYNWNGTQNRNVWALAQGKTATIDKPVKMDADIWGLEAGFDIQNDVNNTLGVFASYRKGEYDLSGKADKLRSNIGSEIDIDSYLAGLYYRYDKNMNWLFATVYGGVQQADAKSNDGLAKFDTDGIEFGAGVEAGHTFALSNDLTLDPSLGLYYTQINFDDAKDNLGKEYSWKDIKHLEAELGAKLEKQINYAKVYVKPSVVQTITSGDKVTITGLNKLSTYDDGTLGRIELGGRYGFSDALSVYGWVNYTFGSDYDATAFGAGLNYAW